MFLTKISKHKLLIMLLIAFILPSCTHIHVPADATLANQLKDDFSKVTANDSNIYSAMLENKEQMEAKEQLRLDALKKEKSAAFANQVYAKKWQQIQTELADKRDKLTKQLGNIIISLDNINKRLSDMEGKEKLSDDTLKEAKLLLKKAAEAQNQWNAKHELFRQSIKSIADITVAEETEADFDAGKALGAAKDNILKTKITVVDGNGKEEVEKKEIQSVLKINEDTFTNIMQANSGNLFDSDAAPGIKIVILGLAVDLADKELRRNKLDIAYLETVIALLEEQKDGSLNIKEAIEIISDAENIIAASPFKKEDTVLKTINVLRKNHDERDSLLNAFRTIGDYSVVMVNNDELFQDLQLAMLDHEYSIKLSAINAQEHEALISRGLEGLAAYHGGGITPETIANFLRAAQAVALGVIGAGVL